MVYIKNKFGILYVGIFLRKETLNMAFRIMNAIALTLVIVGAVNWGLIGFFGFDLVAALFGDMSGLSRVIYALVGLAGIYSILFYKRLSLDEA